MRALALLLLALPCFGCSHATGGYGGDMEFGGSPRTARGALSVSEAGGEEPSLFKTDTEVLSDSAIRRILEYRLELPSSSRLAVLQVGARSVGDWRWSGEPRLPSEVSDKLPQALRNSARVRSASALPSLLVPRQRTVGYLREASARYQAELLLVYRTDCRTFERNRVLASDVVKAACVEEAV